MANPDLPTNAVAEVIVRADTSQVEPDIEKGVRKAAKDSDQDFERIGHELGGHVEKGMEDRLESAGPDLARAVETGIGRQKVKTKVTVELDRDRNVVRQWVTTVTEDLDKEVKNQVLDPSSPIRKLNQTWKDAIGAIFNVSGKSPLIYLLVIVFGALAQVIGAAIQGASSLVAILTLIPNLLFAIGLQGGVLFLIFHGLGEAIGNAFKAENAEDFNKAIAGLAPAAQDFVRQLMPIRETIKELSTLAQQNFFTAFGDTLKQLDKSLGPGMAGHIASIATALGEFARHVLLFFDSDIFKRFVDQIVPEITRWLDEFGPDLFTFLHGLTNFGIALIPFLRWFGDTFSEMISNLGMSLSDLSRDPDFKNWLEQMKTTFVKLGTAIKAVGVFIVSFASALNKAGGDKLLDTLTEALNTLSAFFQSEEGIKAMEGLIDVLNLLLKLFAGLVIAIGLVLFLLEVTAEFIKNWLLPLIGGLFGSIGDFFDHIRQVIEDFFNNLTRGGGPIPQFVIEAAKAFNTFRTNTLFAVGATVNGVVNSLGSMVNAVALIAATIPYRVAAAVADGIGGLFSSGFNIVGQIALGMLSAIPRLKFVLGLIASLIEAFFPHSPAEMGPLSPGEGGDPLDAGKSIVERLAIGMDAETPTLAAASSNVATTIVFGANAINMGGFHGALPTATQATGIGSAIGNGINGVLAQRDARLGIRAMAGAA